MMIPPPKDVNSFMHENIEIVEVFLFPHIQLTNTFQLSPQPIS